ncbi:molybdenum cofactor guanylyltransferase MobA [Xanthobacter sp. V2C-8]|uniref:molybdenum cofactor guanylyltransferase MobA n=1 Tax=Xanthobacter albus TaxID=3119929 RepID=UPI00372ABA21
MSASPLPFGLILAGGHGRRMAGAQVPSPALPKPLVHLAGQPLIAHVIARVAPQVRALAINTNDPPELYAPFGLPVIPDTVGERPGPLAGVLAGLEWLAREAPDACLLTVAADTPFLPHDLVSRIIHRYAETAGVVCAASAGQVHHVIALWPQAARAPLAEALAAGQRKVGLLLAALGAVTESWDAADGDPFFNVNTPEDLAAAESRSHACR